MLLFIFGAGLAYCTLPQALEFLSAIGGDDIAPVYTPDKYFTLIAYMMLAFGIGFEFPILLVLLQIVGVLDARSQLRQCWRYAIVGIVDRRRRHHAQRRPDQHAGAGGPDGHLLRGRRSSSAWSCNAAQAQGRRAAGRAVTARPAEPTRSVGRATTSRSTRSSSRPSPRSTPGESVLVAAPTGSGKTVVAEYAVARALAGGRQGLLHHADQGAVEPEVRRPASRRHGADARRPAHRRQRHQRRRARSS